MKSLMKLFVGVAAVALMLAIAAPPAEAQCGAGPRSFASIAGGGSTLKVRFDGNAGEQAGHQIGHLWSCDNPNDGNNWFGNANQLPETDETVGCPAIKMDGTDNWWQVSQTTLRGINGQVASADCKLTACPDTDLCLLLEDYGPGGPGSASTAYFVMARVEFTPTAVRFWDYAVIAADQSTLPLTEFPAVKVTASSKVGANTQLDYTYDNANVGGGTYVYSLDTGNDNLGIVSAELFISYGSDGGRDRFSGNWTSLGTLAYNTTDEAVGNINAPTSIEVNCDTQTDAWVAAGLNFVGGVQSALVGPPTIVQCDPDLAEPQPKPRPSARPRDPRRPSSTTRGGR